MFKALSFGRDQSLDCLLLSVRVRFEIWMLELKVIVLYACGHHWIAFKPDSTSRIRNLSEEMIVLKTRLQVKESSSLKFINRNGEYDLPRNKIYEYNALLRVTISHTPNTKAD